ncbi:hypothetical protein Pelo_8353 [Pelomyxa schiedti]|nr:hypothetical protein Pelo_8353 [Pelomyxa schiedti]
MSSSTWHWSTKFQRFDLRGTVSLIEEKRTRQLPRSLLYFWLRPLVVIGTTKANFASTSYHKYHLIHPLRIYHK